jgi:hypothetical protein
MQSLHDATLANSQLDLLERICDVAPVPIITNIDFTWWYKFVLSWQSMRTRKLTMVSSRNRKLVTPVWIDSMFHQFYMTDEFQLWSMNNMDKRVKDTWESFKWPSKEIIYNFTKDADYRDHKTKWPSLGSVFTQRHTFNFIDEDWRLFDDLDAAEYYEPANDFI